MNLCWLWKMAKRPKQKLEPLRGSRIFPRLTKRILSLRMNEWVLRQNLIF